MIVPLEKDGVPVGCKGVINHARTEAKKGWCVRQVCTGVIDHALGWRPIYRATYPRNASTTPIEPGQTIFRGIVIEQAIP